MTPQLSRIERQILICRSDVRIVSGSPIDSKSWRVWAPRAPLRFLPTERVALSFKGNCAPLTSAPLLTAHQPLRNHAQAHLNGRNHVCFVQVDCSESGVVRILALSSHIAALPAGAQSLPPSPSPTPPTASQLSTSRSPTAGSSRAQCFRDRSVVAFHPLSSVPTRRTG